MHDQHQQPAALTVADCSGGHTSSRMRLHWLQSRLMVETWHLSSRTSQDPKLLICATVMSRHCKQRQKHSLKTSRPVRKSARSKWKTAALMKTKTLTMMSSDLLQFLQRETFQLV